MNTPTPLQQICHSSLPMNPKLKYKIGKEKLKTRESTAGPIRASSPIWAKYIDQSLQTRPAQGAIPHQLTRRNEIWPKHLP